MTAVEIVVLVAGSAVVGAIVTGLFGRRVTASTAASQFADAAATLISPMTEQLHSVRSELAEVRERVARLEVENTRLEEENETLRQRVSALEAQVRGLGHEPVEVPRLRRMQR